MVNRLILFFAVSLWVPLSLRSQTTVSSIHISKERIGKAQAFQLSDTVFMSYFKGSKHGGVYFYPGGQTELVDLNGAGSLSGVQRVANKSFYYFLEKKGKGIVALKALFLDMNNKTSKVLEKEILISSEIVGVVNDDILSIVTWNKSERLIEVYRINQFNCKKSGYQLPDNNSDLDASDLQLVSPRAGWLFQGISWAKIYVERDRVSLNIDRIYNTDIIVFNGSEEKPKVVAIPSKSTGFRSFLSDSLLFRFNMFVNGFYVKVFHANKGTELLTKTLNKEDFKKTDTIYFHSGKDHVRTHRYAIDKIITSYSFGAEPVVVANKISSGEYGITIGCFFNKKGMGFAASSNPVGFFATLAATTAYRQLSESPAESSYFYTEFSKGDINFRSNPSLIYKRVDDFDIHKSKNARLEAVMVKDSSTAYLIVSDLKAQTVNLVRIRR